MGGKRYRGKMKLSADLGLWIAICTGCGHPAVVQVRRGPPAMTIVYNAVQVADSFDGKDDQQCPTCGAPLVYPKAQDILQAAFLMGGFEAVLPEMIVEKPIQAVYKAGLASAEATAEVAKRQGARKRRR